MNPAHIRTRVTKSGNRYDVRYRLGGRGFKLLHGGSFRTLTEARARRDLIAGELANGRDPRTLLSQIGSPAARVTLASAYNDFIASRLDVTDKTRAGYRHAQARLGNLADKTPAEITPADWQDWIVDNLDLAPGSLGVYMSNHRLVLDFADVFPNPARNPKVKLPAEDDEDEAEYEPPSSQEWAKIMLHIKARSRLVVRLIECAALRLSEASELTYGDIDFAEQRIRVSAARTKGRRGRRRPRWVATPPELLDEIVDLCSLEDRARDRKVFDRLTDAVIYKDCVLACRDAGIAHYHPHDLRHRRISLWIAHGIDVVTVKTWAGHSRASISTDTYGHVIVGGSDAWRDFWLAVYDRERRLSRRAGEARVMHDDPDNEGLPHV